MEIIFVFSRVGGEVEEQLVRHGIFTNTLIGSPKGTVEISEVTEIPSCATSFSGGVFALVTGCTKLFPPPSAFETRKGSPEQSPEAILCRNRYQRRPWRAKVVEVVEVVEVVKIVQVHTTVRQFDQRRPLCTPGRFFTSPGTGWQWPRDKAAESSVQEVQALAIITIIKTGGALHGGHGDFSGHGSANSVRGRGMLLMIIMSFCN